MLKNKRKFILGLVGTYTLVELAKYIKSRVYNYKLCKKAKAKLESRNSNVPNLPQIPAGVESLVLSLTVTELSAHIKSGKLTSVEIVSTYIKRALTIGRVLHLTAEECFEQALSEAYKCDQETANGHSRGLLHGIPISVKEHYGMKGYTSACGLTWKLDYPDTEDAVLVQLLVDQGAIPFVRSNVCQAMMWIESSNKLYGRADNPWNTSRTTGGSSSGEGGLVASRSSPLGIGSDIGGSVRIPSHFCGVYGFKPCPKRFSIKGIKTIPNTEFEGFESTVKGSFGPIGRCVDDLALVIRSWFNEKAFEYDPTVVPLKFNESDFGNSKRLRIGYYTHLNGYPVADCIKNAILKCAELLSEECEMVPYTIPHTSELMKSFFEAYTGNAEAEFVGRELNGEDPEPFFEGAIYSINHPYLFKLQLTLLSQFGNQRLADYLDNGSNFSSLEYVDRFQSTQDLVHLVIADWSKQELDAVICPIYGMVATPHNATVEVGPCLGYSYIMNVLAFPAGVVPVGTVKEGENYYKDEYDDLLTKACSSVMENSQGLPYSIQVVGLPYKDETVLNVMKKIEKVFNFHSFAL